LLPLLREAASADSWNEDKHGNKWREVSGRVEYEFEPDVPPSRRTWPPRQDHIKTAELAMLRNGYKTDKSDLLQVVEGEKLVRYCVQVPAFLPPNKSGVSRIAPVKVQLDLRGLVVDKRPSDCVPLPSLVARYARFIHQGRKTVRRDTLKGYFKSGFYVRFGAWSGPSTFGLVTNNEDYDEWSELGKRHEMGVSVYGVRRIRGRWVLEDIDRSQAVYGVGDYWEHMLGSVLRNRPLYLVRGVPIAIEDSQNPDKPYLAKGSDGEPLLELDSVHKVQQLNPYEVFVIDTKSESGVNVGNELSIGDASWQGRIVSQPAGETAMNRNATGRLAGNGVSIWFGDSFIGSPKAFGQRGYPTLREAVSAAKAAVGKLPSPLVAEDPGFLPPGSVGKPLASSWKLGEAVNAGIVLHYPQPGGKSLYMAASNYLVKRKHRPADSLSMKPLPKQKGTLRPLHASVIRLAYQHPELRKHLLPLL